MSLRRATAVVLTAPSPGGLWELRSQLLEAEIPDGDPVWGLVGVVHGIQGSGRSRQTEIQEHAVVGNHKHRSRKLPEKVLKPKDGFNIQMIGGLIEQQDIAAGTEQFGQVDPVPLPAGQVLHPLLLVRPAEIEAAEISPGVHLVAVHGDQLLAIGYFFPDGLDRRERKCDQSANAQDRHATRARRPAADPRRRRAVPHRHRPASQDRRGRDGVGIRWRRFGHRCPLPRHYVPSSVRDAGTCRVLALTRCRRLHRFLRMPNCRRC